MQGGSTYEFCEDINIQDVITLSYLCSLLDSYQVALRLFFTYENLGLSDSKRLVEVDGGREH